MTMARRTNHDKAKWNGVGNLLPRVAFHCQESLQWQKVPDTFAFTVEER